MTSNCLLLDKEQIYQKLKLSPTYDCLNDDCRTRKKSKKEDLLNSLKYTSHSLCDIASLSDKSVISQTLLNAEEQSSFLIENDIENEIDKKNFRKFLPNFDEKKKSTLWHLFWIEK